MAAKRRLSSSRPVLFDVLESRALLSVVYSGVELQSARSPKQTLIQGTIRGHVTRSKSAADPSVFLADYRGRGTASHFGRVSYSGIDTTYQLPGFVGGTFGDATLTTSKGEKLAIVYELSQVIPGTLSGEVLDIKRTGQVAKGIGTFSGQEATTYDFDTQPFRLKFTIKVSR
jgi:hypothetical protein